MKKGQQEMIGLAIIVILLILSLLFYVTLKSSSQEEAELIRTSTRANNILNAVLLTKVDENYDMKNLLKECVNSPNENSGECEAAEGNLTLIFNGIMLPRQGYRFNAHFLSMERGTCEEFVNANPARFPGGYKYEFKLCYS